MYLGELETTSHLIFECPVSNFQWCCVKEAFGWDRKPNSFDEFLSLAIRNPGVGSNYIGWAIFGALSWLIWLSRNDAVFNKKIIKSPLNMMFKTISFLTQWTCMLPGKREGRWRKMLEKMQLVARRMQLISVQGVVLDDLL